MAVKRRNGTYDVTCDECGGDHDFAENTFQDAIDRFKESGGRVYKDDDDDWRHACGDCRTQ